MTDENWQRRLDRITSGVLVADTSGTVTFASRPAAQLLGGEPEDLVGVHLAAVTTTLVRPDGTEVELAHRAGHTVLEAGQAWQDLVSSRDPRSGEMRWIEVLAQPVLDPSGRIVEGVFQLADVTERQRDRALLFAAEEIADIGSWELDWVTETLEWSPQTYRIFGRDPSGPAPTYEDFLLAIHPDDRALVDGSFHGPVHHRGTYDVVHRILVNGAVRWVHERGLTELGADGAPRRSIGTVQHVTAHRDAQERLRATQTLEALGRITSELAHDVNNLLTVVATSVELARLDLDEATTAVVASGHLQTALDACQRGEELTARLLAMTHRQQLEPSAVDLRDLLEGFLPVAHAVLGAKAGIELHLADVPLPVHLDRNGFDTALLNLVTNAHDAIGEGARVVLGADRTATPPSAHRPREGSAQFARIWVSDNGSGIDATVISRVFEPFFTTKPPGAGTGLGLPMVVDFADRSGGTATLDSEVGVGTTVTIWLPLAE